MTLIAVGLGLSAVKFTSFRSNVLVADDAEAALEAIH
jgi:hypothetical protein